MSLISPPLRPNSDGSKKAITHSTGSVAFSLLDDTPDDDATYVRVVDGNTYPSNYLHLGLTDMAAIAATQRILRVRTLVRSRVNSTGASAPAHVETRLWDHQSGLGFPGANKEEMTPGGVDRFSTTNGSLFSTRTGAWKLRPPPLDGQEWTRAVVNRLILHMAWHYSAGPNHLNQRVSEVYVDVDVRDQPFVTGVGVTGNDSSTRPTGSWVYNANLDDDPQIAYRAKVFSAAQYGAAGFDPDTSGAVWDSGERTGGAASIQVAVDLQTGTTYRFYVKAAQDFLGERWYSAWANSADFTITITPPAVPTMTITQDSSVPWLRHLIQLQHNANLLNAKDSSFEAGLDSYVPSNATLLASATFAAHGTQSMRMTATAAADMSAETSGFPFKYKVKPGVSYTALASFRAGTTNRSAHVDLRWYDKAGALISTTTGGNITSATGSFTQATVTGTAPATAWYCQVRVFVVAPGAGEQHYVDKVSLSTSSSTTWTVGGMTGGTTGGGGDGPGSTIVECSWATVGEGNLAHPQLYGAGDGFQHNADGFFAFPVTGTGLVEYDKTERFHGDGSVLWRVRDTGGKLYLGWPQAAEVNPSPAYPLAAVPGRTYSFALWAKASQTFSSQLNLQAIDKDGGNVGASVNGGAISITTGWQVFRVQGFTIPAGAVWVKAWLDNTAAVEPRNVWVDHVQWQLGSTLGDPEQPSGQPTVWTPVRGAAEGELLARDEDGVAMVIDAEVPPGYTVTYRARNFLPSTPPVASADTPYQQLMLDPPGPGNWVLKAVGSELNVLRVNVLGPIDESQQEEAGTFRPLRPTTWGKFNQRPVVVSDFLGGHDGVLKLAVSSEDEWWLLRQLVGTPGALFLVEPHFGARYIRIMDRGWSRRGLRGAGVAAADECPPGAAPSRWLRELALPFLEIDRPDTGG
jgi:hypothetical protein